MPENKATAADAQIIMQLYDLRREPEMRKAREWFILRFIPGSVEDVTAVYNALGTDENRWLRQFTGYWEMAASFVTRGALDPVLFEDNNGEMFTLYARFKPYLKELREVLNAPEFLMHVEKLAEGTERSRLRASRVEAILARVRERLLAMSTAKK